MQAPKKVLVAVDAAESTTQVMREAQMVAKTFGAELTFVHAIPEATPSSPGFDVLADQVRERFAEIAAETRSLGVEVDEDFAIEYGSPADVIEKVHRERGCDWIVLGAGGKSTLDRLLLGSTAEAVLRHQNAPVWVVRPGRVYDLNKITVAVDDSPAGLEAMRGGVFMSRCFVAKLRVLTVGEAETASAVQAMLRTEVDLHGVDVEFGSREGEVSEGILRDLREHLADLLVLGHTGRTGLLRLLRGNTAEELTRTSPCSLLSLHADA